jgi:DNA sulfur modification protein DndD
MRLLALELENFGVFQGHHRLELADSDHRNGHPDRILVVGHNGSGKSTLFRAISLALYGSAAIGSRVGRDAYEQALAELIHRGPASSTRTPATGARVAVEIEHIEFGEPVRLRVERTWSRGRASVKERFSVTPLDDGGPESEVDPEQALNTLLPAELRRFVLVDVTLIDELTATLQSWGTL